MWKELVISGNQKMVIKWTHWTPMIHFKCRYNYVQDHSLL